MESFKKVNAFGIESNFYVVAETKEDGKDYIIYTDFVPAWKGDMKLYAGVREEGDVKEIPKEKEEALIREFKSEMDKFKSTELETLQYDDLSFTTIGENGEEKINDITKVIPNANNKEEPYVIFTDYSLDEKDEFIEHYGRLVQVDGNFMLETKLTDEEIKYIQEMSENEVVKYVNDMIEESLNE